MSVSVSTFHFSPDSLTLNLSPTPLAPETPFPHSCTRGLKVYLHKGRYYVYYNRSDSYPDGLGLETLYEIPRNVSKEEFCHGAAGTYCHIQRNCSLFNSSPTCGSSTHHRRGASYL